jgi:hypothetical protein
MRIGPKKTENKVSRELGDGTPDDVAGAGCRIV